MESRRQRTLRLTATVLFPLLVGGLVVLFAIDRPAYLWLLREDGLAENLTALNLAAASFLAFALASHAVRSDGSGRAFYLCFGAFCALGLLEEISWGQRLLGIESPEFFLRNSDQEETNLHNVFQQWTGLKTRWIAGLALVVYGTLLPLTRSRKLDAWITWFGLRLPPRFLALGFGVGSLAAILDMPTGDEEEFGEYILSLCLALFMLSEWFALPAPAPARRAPG